MDLRLTAEQEALRHAMREALRRTRRDARVPVAAQPDTWALLASMGVLGLLIPEDAQGSGAGAAELVVVMEELGRSLSNEPVLESALVPGFVVAGAGNRRQRERLLPGLATGAITLAFAHEEPGDRWPHCHVEALAEPGEEKAHRLFGAKALVASGDRASHLVVTARLGGGMEIFIVDVAAPGIVSTPFRAHGGARGGAAIEFDGTPAEHLSGGRAADIVAEADIWWQLGLCAEAVGVMERALEITASYLSARTQFGRRLSTFQALAHRAADLYAQLELSRSLVLFAAASVADDVQAAVAVSRAALQVCRTARRCGYEVVHLHGGVGVTAEHEIGHFASRLLAIEQLLGGAEAHLAVLDRLSPSLV